MNKFEKAFLECTKSVFEEVNDVLHEVVVVRVFLVFDRHIECVSKDLHHVGAVSRRHEIEGNAQVFHEFVLALCGPLVDVDFIGYDNAGDVGTMMSHLLVPALQILISHLSRGVEHQYSCMSPEVIRWMQFIE